MKTIRNTLAVSGAILLLAAKCYGQTPTADQLFRRYVAAAGGEAAIRAVATRFLIGELVTGAGRAHMEVVQAAPDKFLRTIDSPASGRSENAWDGTTAWSRNQRGTRVMAGVEVGLVRRELHLYRPIALRDFYTLLAPPRADTLEGLAVFSVTGTTPDSVTETLHFDRATGLLAGWDVVVQGTTLRTIVSDYRAVDGVMLPYRARHLREGFSWTDEWTRIEQNAPVPAARFAKP